MTSTKSTVTTANPVATPVSTGSVTNPGRAVKRRSRVLPLSAAALLLIASGAIALRNAKDRPVGRTAPEPMRPAAASRATATVEVLPETRGTAADVQRQEGAKAAGSVASPGEPPAAALGAEVKRTAEGPLRKASPRAPRCDPQRSWTSPR